jgi:Tetracyclin repressor-like, C-terminal domain
MISTLLVRGAETGVFRKGVDPIQLYISIAALGFFYLSNRYTLSTIFGRDFAGARELNDRGRHIVDVVLSYLRP